MFRRVGKKFHDADVEEAFWYRKSSWTTAEQQDFVKWAIEAVQKDPNYKFWSVERIERSVQWFVFDFGWSIVDEDGDGEKET